jgi:hypothetical protein
VTLGHTDVMDFISVLIFASRDFLEYRVEAYSIRYMKFKPG